MAGGGGFGATTESVERAIGVATSTHETISGQLKSLQGNIDGEVGPWRGPTKQAFMGLTEAWFADGQKILTALEEMINGLKSNLSGYEQNQTEGSQHMTRVTQMINGGAA